MTDATAFGSPDGVTWTRLRTVSIGARLARQGIAASSHGAGPMRFVFGALRRDARRVAVHDLHGESVGDCAAGSLNDGG
jgi:hypothetical protein